MDTPLGKHRRHLIKVKIRLFLIWSHTGRIIKPRLFWHEWCTWYLFFQVILTHTSMNVWPLLSLTVCLSSLRFLAHLSSLVISLSPSLCPLAISGVNGVTRKSDAPLPPMINQLTITMYYMILVPDMWLVVAVKDQDPEIVNLVDQDQNLECPETGDLSLGHVFLVVDTPRRTRNQSAVYM